MRICNICNETREDSQMKYHMRDKHNLGDNLQYTFEFSKYVLDSEIK